MGTIAKDLTDKLRQQQNQGAGVIEAGTDNGVIRVDVEHSERYAVGIRGISVQPATPVNVNDAAERIAGNVDALGEPLQIVEVDRGAKRAVVRSAQPDADEAGVTYWEADVQPDQTTLHRFRKDHSAPDRAVIAEPLPHAVAGKVAEQLSDAISQG